MRKMEEPESPESGKVGKEVKVKGEAHLTLLREVVAIPEELSTLPVR